ncbi:unnamed protein product [Mesocestoides corti]|nr:unnamed protein product [Mesocestoides corti]
MSVTSTRWLFFCLLFVITLSFDMIDVPEVCRPQLQTANCWYYRPNYVYNHLLDRCIWSGWSSCNSELNSFSTRRQCERICLGSRRRGSPNLHERDEYYSPGFYEETPSRRYRPYEGHQID